ncbi:hypothetical protein KA107_01720 [Candidatus Pacearchaeota archaeon]|nr:hypothetical protein [Candidatus Pacearchaeota archaeon]
MRDPNRYLFVCMANRNRSIVGERVFRQMLTAKGFSVGSWDEQEKKDFYVGSAGMVLVDEVGRRFEASMLEGTRNFFVANDTVRYYLRKWHKIGADSRLVDLDIPDVYDISKAWQEDQLYEILRKKLAPYLPEKK